MIDITEGNLLEADAEALVNTVNCVGIMGKGIALQFKQAFPANYKAYEKACHAKQIRPGKMFVIETSSMFNPKYIINFPTKRHWRGKSKIGDIKSGLKALIAEVKRLDIKSIAVPPLGCGNGGLEWSVVRPMIEKAFADLPDVNVSLFAPHGAPDADEMPVRTKKANMTRARALFIKLIELYCIPGYRLSLLEIQKLAYFLQEAGEPMNLRFEKQTYGPYAENLHFVLQRIEGHFIRGYGDRSRDTQLHLLPKAIEKANKFLDRDADAESRLEQVKQLIEGFETPYGMELLSTVHWVARKESPAATDHNSAIEMTRSWNDRKRKIMKPEHIQIAWDRLQDKGWLN